VRAEATVEGSDHLRLFYGLPFPPGSADELARWASDAYSGSQGVRVVPGAHLHLTLAFLGARPSSELPVLRHVLCQASDGVQQPELTVRRYRETDRVGMVVLDDRHGIASLLQERLSELLARLGVYVPERRPWLAHVTVARFRRRPRLRMQPPDLGTVSPSEAALYHSLLRSGGAQYDIVEAVRLGG
jgi:2'-5' RNA ligase